MCNNTKEGKLMVFDNTWFSSRFCSKFRSGTFGASSRTTFYTVSPFRPNSVSERLVIQELKIYPSIAFSIFYGWREALRICPVGMPLCCWIKLLIKRMLDSWQHILCRCLIREQSSVVSDQQHCHYWLSKCQARISLWVFWTKISAEICFLKLFATFHRNQNAWISNAWHFQATNPSPVTG